jgi:hypothetical protein
MARIDHTNCTHPRTPAGRRGCRSGSGAPRMPRSVGREMEIQSKRLPVMTDEIKITGATARKLARHAAKADRIQPRRSGARVSINSSGCVQAALHVDAHGGRCACGWTAEKVA